MSTCNILNLIRRRKEDAINISESILNRYRLERILGSGRNGDVYLAFHNYLKVHRAIKVVPKLMTEDFDKFMVEANIIKNCKHPGIPIIHDLEETDGNLYIIEEYVSGITLKERIDRYGAMTYRELIDFAMNLCEPISFLHSRNILHLDIQPGNLILNKTKVNVIDFDHSKPFNEKPDGYGTVGFAAPEQYRSGAGVGVRSDIYAIAAIIYYAGTAKVYREDVYPGNWDKEFTELLKTALSTNPNERYTTVGELLTELNTVRSKLKPSFRMGVVSAQRGGGASFFAFNICSYMKKRNVGIIYEEHDASGHCIELARRNKVKIDSRGYFKYKNILCRTDLNTQTEIMKSSDEIIVEDYGNRLDTAISEKCDILLLVCVSDDSRFGENIRAMKKLAKEKYFLLYNFSSNRVLIPDFIDTGRCISMPAVGEPKELEGLFQKMFKEMSAVCGDEALRRLIRKMNMSR